MKTEFIDLVSRKHRVMRDALREELQCSFHHDFTRHESYLVFLANKDQYSISKMACVMGVSRQAVHKISKKLNKEGFVTFEEMPGNKKEKLIQLTKLGIEYCEFDRKAKRKIERQIKKVLGEEAFLNLKEFLVQDWLGIP